jgi:hypothetical protein
MDSMSELKLTEAQTEALFNYIDARTRRYGYAKHGGLMVTMAVAAYFIMRALVATPGDSMVPHWIEQWIPPLLAGTGIVIAIFGAAMFAWVVSTARENLRRAGLSDELIVNFDRYPVRELAKRFRDRT